jgi:trimeric autotransporter adhesin
MELCIGNVPGALDGRRSIVHRPGEAIHLRNPFANCVLCPKLSVAAKGGTAGSPLQPNTMTIRTRLALVSLCTVGFAACSGDSSGPPAVASVAVSSPGTDIIVGQTASLTATPKDAKGNTLTNRTVAWTSSSQTIATVSSTGVVTGVGPGNATITATVEGKTGTAGVTVVVPPVATVTVTAVATTLQAGQTTQASAVTRDASNTVVTGRTVAWSTSNQAVATVSGTGVVTALTAGVVTITATSEGKTGTVQITVNAGNPADAPQITSVTPSPLVEGQAATITGTKFGATADANVVRIGGVAASVTAVSATSLQIIVPNLNCKPAQNVNVDVTVAGNLSTPKSQAFIPGGAPFTLAQGRQVLLGVPANFCLQFPASNASETYLIGVQSVSEAVTSVTPATVTAQAPTGDSPVVLRFPLHASE